MLFQHVMSRFDEQARLANLMLDGITDDISDQ